MKVKKLLSALVAGLMLLGTMSVPTFAEDAYEGFTDFETAVKNGIVTSVEAVVADGVSLNGYEVWTPGKAELGNGPLADAKFGEKDGNKLFVVWRYKNDNATPYITKEVKIDNVIYQTVIDMTVSEYSGFFTSQDTTKKAKIETGVTVKGADKFFYSNHGLKTLDIPASLVSQLNLASTIEWAYYSETSEQYESYTVGSELTGYTADRIVLQGANQKPRNFRYLISDGKYADKKICAYFAVKVDPNGGSCDGHTELYTLIESISNNVTFNSLPIKEGYVFNGWTVSNDDINKVITLTAKWADAPCVHDFVETIIKDSTCTEEGSKTLTCSKCNTVENVTIPKKDHIYKEEITKEATCTEAGNKKLTCVNCSTIKNEPIKALGHNFVNGECTRCHIENPMEAKIGDIKYDTLAEAIEAAKDGDTIVLLENIEKDEAYKIEGKKLTLELNGKSISANVSGATLSITNGANVTIQDSVGGSVITEKKTSYCKAIWMNNSTLRIYGGKYVGCGVYGGIETSGGTLEVVNAEFVNTFAYGNTFTTTGGTVATLDNVTVTATGGADGLWVQGGDVTVKSGVYNTAYTAQNGSTLTILGGTFNGTVGKARNYGSVSISGGLFAENVIDYVMSGYTIKPEGSMFRVVKAEAKVIDTAKTAGAEITLDDLERHDNINTLEDATYQVVIKTAPKADVEAVNEAIKTAADTNADKQIFDISVIKIDSRGTQTDISKTITNQQVTLTLAETPVGDVTVYHVNDSGVVDFTTTVTPNGNKVSFIAPSFSTYAVTYTANSLAEDKIAKEVGVAFERIGDTSAYDIVLKARDSKQINRFMSADLTFDLKVTAGDVGYTVKPAANINLVDNNDGRYEFNLDGVNASGVTGASINIGTVTFEGTGTVEFSVKDVTTNIVNTAKAADNIVDDYTTNGDGNTTGKLVLNDENANGTIKETFAAPTKDLTILIAFNNAIKDNAAAYQDMTVTVNGSDLAAPIVTHLGTGVAFDATHSVYTVTIADQLTKNSAYTVTVEGAGYRTARYTVTMTADKTLNFWNNVKSAAAYIEEGVGTAKTSNFLAGDIVKDGKINIYDLSAVVSYFGTTNATGAVSPNAKYDLNRDGAIDSKDVAYVLVSWGE